MSSAAYRAEIDGLRAFAVIAVILFHLEVETFSGGFVGVDIFFVISGYLITRLIRNEVVEQGSFNFPHFYMRRARRLLPALFFTLGACFVIAYLLFAPQHFERFGGSLLFSVLSVSNFYFWSESGYFDTSADFKPLLHTWSLGIEEQFYFIWPLVLFLLLTKTKKYFIYVALVAVSVFSLYLNQKFYDGNDVADGEFLGSISRLMSDGPATIFYLLPFRLFEFAIGASIVWLERYRLNNKLSVELICLLGLIAVFLPFYKYDKEIVFPSYNALIPCLGAAMIIYAGRAQYSARLLTNRYVVSIGLISYSLYLIHWPVIVFYKYWKFDEIIQVEKAVLFVISIVLAVVMYLYIEQPFRKNTKIKPWTSKEGAGYLMVAVMLMIPSMSVWTDKGWYWRYPEQIIDQLAFKVDHFHDYVWSRFQEHETAFVNNGNPKVIVVGDSMAADFVNVLAEDGAIDNLDLLAIQVKHGCKSVFPVANDLYEELEKNKADICKKQHQAITDHPSLTEADFVVLASSWSQWSLGLLESTVRYLKGIGVPEVAIVGMKSQSIDGVKFNAKVALRKTGYKLRTPLNKRIVKINEKIRQIKSEFIYINLLEYFCDNDGCQRFTEYGHLIIYDRSHLTPMGARLIAEKSSESQWLKAMLRVN